MIVNAEGHREGKRVFYNLYCRECGGFVCRIDYKELVGLMTVVYGRVICFSCEQRWIDLFRMSPNEEGGIVQ